MVCKVTAVRYYLFSFAGVVKNQQQSKLIDPLYTATVVMLLTARKTAVKRSDWNGLTLWSTSMKIVDTLHVFYKHPPDFA